MTSSVASNSDSGYLKVTSQSVALSCLQDFVDAVEAYESERQCCAICATQHIGLLPHVVLPTDLPPGLLRSVADAKFPGSGCDATGGKNVCERGVVDGRYQVCSNCMKQFNRGMPPKFALANGAWIGEVPAILSTLTMLERALVTTFFRARCRITLYPSSMDLQSHYIDYGVRVTQLERDAPLSLPLSGFMPPPPSFLQNIFEILVVGNSKIVENSLPAILFVRRHRVLSALRWLIANNPLYSSTAISMGNLALLPDLGIPGNILYMIQIAAIKAGYRFRE